MMKRARCSWGRWSLAVCCLAAWAGCAPAPPRSDARPVVVASFFPLFDFARQLAGPEVDVVCLTPPGGEPHGMELTPSTVKQAAGARLVLLLGMGMDDWAAKVATHEAGARLARVGEGLATRLPQPDPVDADATNRPTHPPDAEHDHGHESAHAHTHSPSEADPHVWMDPVLAQELARRVAAELASALPDRREDIHARRDKLVADLARLHQEFGDAAKSFRERRVVTFHGAFGYLFARYGLELAGCVEPFPGKEPSVAYLRGLVDLMRRLKLDTIFAEPQLPETAARLLAEEIGGQVERLDPCETILPTAPERTYVERQRDNLAVLQRVLGAPARP